MFLARILFLLLAASLSLPAANTPNFEDIQIFLDVPPMQASVVDAFLPKTMYPDFVIVQDAHRNPEVQSRLAWIVMHGYKRWGVRKVFVEGAFEPIDLSVFHMLNDRERQSVSDHLIGSGQLSGPERAGILIHEMEWRNPPTSPFMLVGMEEPSLYQANLAAYRAVLNYRAEAQKEVAGFRRLHNSLSLPETHVLRRHLLLVQKMLDLRVTPAEYARYVEIQEAVPSSSKLTPALNASEMFYELANQRSLVFIKNVERKFPAAGGPRVLITGGFHSSLIARQLREEGHSFVVLAPRATIPATDALYERRLLETSCFF